MAVMKMPALLARNTEELPGVTGIARIDKNTKRLLNRVGPGDIAILDEVDLDRVCAGEVERAQCVHAQREPRQGRDHRRARSGP